VQPGGVVVGLSKKADGKDGDAKNWGLNPENITVVFYNRHKFIKRWDTAASAVNDQLIADVAAEADKEMKRK
jgi:hypothetical protein